VVDKEISTQQLLLSVHRVNMANELPKVHVVECSSEDSFRQRKHAIPLVEDDGFQKGRKEREREHAVFSYRCPAKTGLKRSLLPEYNINTADY
jgi:hypothetical protein